MDDLERLIQVLIDFGRRNTPVFRLKWTFSRRHCTGPNCSGSRANVDSVNQVHRNAAESEIRAYESTLQALTQGLRPEVALDISCEINLLPRSVHKIVPDSCRLLPCPSRAQYGPY
jgi:hypothetical protein